MIRGQDDEEQVRQKRTMKCKNFAQDLQGLKQNNKTKEIQILSTPRGQKVHIQNSVDCCQSQKKPRERRMP